MGANMMIAILPVCKWSEDRHAFLIKTIAEMSTEQIVRTEWVQTFDGTDDEYRAVIADAVEQYWKLDDHRDVAVIWPEDGIQFYASGGLSSGDEPTYSFEPMNLIADVLYDKLLEFARQDRQEQLGVTADQARSVRMQARYQYGSEDIEIPDDAKVEDVEDRHWVEARVWLYKEEQ